MLTRLRHLWTHHRLLTLLFAAALAATAFFGVRTVRQAIYWADPAHQNQPLEAWMPPNYVGMSYKLPPEVLIPILGLNPGGPRERVTMGDIAAAQGITLTELQSRIEAAAEAHRAARGD
ncbi:hypothetical protein [Marivivens marinus]|uniref:hypothetical protein n=1 Tax=Marivivens marinus TaxID=3110173 RepID=UPI003B848AE7